MPGIFHFTDSVKAICSARMSLNRSEQMVLDYVLSHPDERQHWMDKVRAETRSAADVHDAARGLELDLWSYYVERSQVVEPFKGTVLREGSARVSMRNLSDYLCRLWGVPRPKKPSVGTYDGM